nr:unnamed protein product [Callosobruchus analis]
MNNNDILNDVTKLIKPAELKICVNNTRKIKDGIAVHCDNDISLSKLKESMVNTLGPNYKTRSNKAKSSYARHKHPPREYEFF